MPSTSTPGMPKPSARSAMSSPPTDQVDDVDLGVAVVLDDEDRRQVPDRGEVERLEGGALVGGAVAEEGDRDAAGRPASWRSAPRRRSAAGRRRRCRWRRACPWTRSAMCIEPPLPPHRPVALAEDLGHHRRRRRSPWRNDLQLGVLAEVVVVGDRADQAVLARPEVDRRLRRSRPGRASWSARRSPSPARRPAGARTARRRGCGSGGRSLRATRVTRPARTSMCSGSTRYSSRRTSTRRSGARV